MKIKLNSYLRKHNANSMNNELHFVAFLDLSRLSWMFLEFFRILGHSWKFFEVLEEALRLDTKPTSTTVVCKYRLCVGYIQMSYVRHTIRKARVN